MIRDCAHEALEDLREVIGVLRVSPADESRRAGMRVLLESEVAGVVPAVVGRSAYRAVRKDSPTRASTRAAATCR